MISKKTLKALVKKLGIDETKANAAIDSTDEVDLDIPEVEVHPKGAKVFTDAELATRDKAKYDEGKVAGVETEIKEYKKANGLDFKGKTLKDLHEAVKVKGDDAEVVEKLRKTVTELETERDNARAEAGKVMRRQKIHEAIPEVNNGMSKREVEALMEANGYEFKEEGGKIVPYKDGEKVKDAKLQTDVEYGEVIKVFVAEKKWTGEPAKKGRGADDSDTKAKPTYTKASEVMKDFEAKHGPGSAMGTDHDYSGHLSKVMKEAEEAGTPLVMD